MKQVGIIGWRGMVGSVLLDRMREEADFDVVAPTFFSTSQAGGEAPRVGGAAGQDAKVHNAKVHDALDVAALAELPILISAQGGEYTQSIHPRLRAAGWQGYWIDAASHAAHGEKCRHRPGSGEPARDAGGARARRQGFHRRQLHGLPDADGGGRAVAGGARSNGSPP